MISIVGKNASVLTYPEKFFHDKNAIGLNSAAVLFETDWAFSLYPVTIKEFQKLFPIEKIIGINLNEPFENYAKTYPEDHWPNTALGIKNHIGHNNSGQLPLSGIAEEVRIAVTGNLMYPYHSRKTCLHLAMLWCICKGHKEIHLFGCNNTPTSVFLSEDADPGTSIEASKERREYTDEIIRCAGTHNIKIKLWKDYPEWKTVH